MHPILGQRLRFLAYLAAWLLGGGLAAGGLWLQYRASPEAALLFALPLAMVFAISALSAHYVCRARPLAARDLTSTLARFGGAALLAGLVWALLAKLWSGVGGLILGGDDLVRLDAGALLTLSLVCAALYLISLLIHALLLAFEHVEEAARREAESRLYAREAELQMLRLQINPHFLFNSLNSICALTQLDPEAASAMTIDLAQFFRSTLALAERKSIPLGDELALCERYLAIEKRRVGDELDYTIDAEGARSVPVPPMLLQPLVENALKHGIRSLSNGGRIDIAAQVRNGWLHIAVTNPFDAQAAPAVGNGVGLANVGRRLAAIYAERARITWRREDERFRVEITLPEVLPG